MIDHEFGRQPEQHVEAVWEFVPVELELNVPSQLGDPGGDDRQIVPPDRPTREHVEPGAASTRLVEPTQLVDAGVGVDDHDGAGGIAQLGQFGDGFELATIVEAVRGGLHDHDSIETERYLEPAVVGHQRIARPDHGG